MVLFYDSARGGVPIDLLVFLEIHRRVLKMGSFVRSNSCRFIHNLRTCTVCIILSAISFIESFSVPGCIWRDIKVAQIVPALTVTLLVDKSLP